MEHAPGQAAANASLLGAAFLWGSFYAVVADMLRAWDPYTLTVARLTLGCVLLLVLVAATEGRRAFAHGLPWGRIFTLGFFGFGVFCILITLGILYSGAIAASLVSSTAPILAAFMVWAFAGRKPKRRVLWAVALAVAGGAVVVFRDGMSDLRGGEVFLLAASAVFIWYTLKVPEWLTGMSPLAITAHTVASGTLVLLPATGLAVWLGWFEPRADLAPRSLAMLAYLSASSVCLAVVLWNHGTKRIRVEIASMYSNLCPVFAVLASMVLGVYPTWAQLAGGRAHPRGHRLGPAQGAPPRRLARVRALG